MERKELAMLRITTDEKPELTTFRLEGKLVGDWVREFDRCWICARITDRSRKIKIDLSNVSFVDEKGKALLARLASEGAELGADNPLMRLVIAGAMEESHLVHVNW
jgi:ABC-type transporter Mla MlaB component